LKHGLDPDSRQQFTHIKWSPVSCRWSVALGKFACQRATFYHCGTQLFYTSAGFNSILHINSRQFAVKFYLISKKVFRVLEIKQDASFFIVILPNDIRLLVTPAWVGYSRRFMPHPSLSSTCILVTTTHVPSCSVWQTQRRTDGPTDGHAVYAARRKRLIEQVIDTSYVRTICVSVGEFDATDVQWHSEVDRPPRVRLRQGMRAWSIRQARAFPAVVSVLSWISAKNVAVNTALKRLTI